MPYSEPNSLPPQHDDWLEWREAYRTHVENFKSSPQRYSDVILLKIRLVRLGFVGLHLEREIEFIKSN